ncbi:MAG: glycoside hydrolase family 15 protein [Burkholderiales bacterium]
MTLIPRGGSLELGLIGNCAISALIDANARIVWSCYPRPDGDPVFHALINNGSASDAADRGWFGVDIEDHADTTQRYIGNSAVIETTLSDRHGNAITIIDFAPRFIDRERVFRPPMIIRRLIPAGRPRVRIQVRPGFEYGSVVPVVTRGSNHLRYGDGGMALRLTTDMPITFIADETSFVLDRPGHLFFGVDETLGSGIATTARDFEERTIAYWRDWVRPLGVPLEWQDAVIRAAITLKLSTFEETGAIIAAVTTSIPEAPGTGRNWDYRYCWLRDAFFVVRALNSLSEISTMENYLGYLANMERSAARDQHLQPVYGIGLERELPERMIQTLTGYRGNGPVRVGNQAYEHHQHDVYGNVVLAATQAFFDRRLTRLADVSDFQRLEWVGEQAVALHDRPDAGMWELRTRAATHTSSSLMCWAATDRLAKIAVHLGLADRAAYWTGHARAIRERILAASWNAHRQVFAERFGGDELDAGVLLMGEVGLIEPADPRWHATVATIGRELGHGGFLLRYSAADDFGKPQTAFLACTFWYIDALWRIGRTEEARALFERVLAIRNRLGLLSEDVDARTGELWGNFPQTYSMVGIINCAMRMSRRWETVL